MPEPRVFGADEVARKEFATSFRGFDQHEVRAFLGRLAAELASLQTRERSLEERLEQADARAIPRELGEDELENALGHETTKVLHAAREAATEIRSRAEVQVARLLREAGDDSTRMREEAATVLADRSAEAERSAAVVRAEAEQAAQAARAEAAASAEATIEAAKEHGRQMVGEAQAVRERILRDLGRRRRAAQQQLEQLRAGRDRLVEACRGVQGALDAATAELVVAEPEARAAAETAGLRVASQPEVPLEELEAEVVAAVDAGLVVSPTRPTEAPDPEVADPEVEIDPEAPAEPSAPAGRSDGATANESTSAAPPTDDLTRPDPPGEAQHGGSRGTAGPGGAGQPRSAAPPAPAEADASPSAARGPGLRRRKRKGGPATVGVVDLGDAAEGVRLLPADDAPVPDAPAPAAEAASPEGRAEDVDAEASAVEVAPVAAEVDGPAGAHAPPAAGGGDSAGTGRGRTSTTVIARTPPTAPTDDASTPSAPVGSAPEGGAPPEQDDGEQLKAGDLFARMRAERKALVAHANEVMAEGASAPDGPGVDPATPDPITPDPATPDPATLEGDEPLAEPGATPDADDAASAISTAFEQRDGDVEAHERALTRALKRALGDEQNQLLDDLRRAKGVPGIDVLLPSAEEQAGRYTTAATRALSAAAAAGGGADVPDADVATLAADLGGDLVEGLRPRLDRAIEGAGGDEATATEALSSAYREWKTSRIEPLARHHVLASWASGAFAATPDVALRWVVDPEVGCSPDCADNVLAGPTMKGDAFPTGRSHPPAHAGCRCLVVPDSR